MKILNAIVEGAYSVGREPAAYNGFGQRHEGAKVYDFGNRVSLHTYTGNCWFLYVDGDIVSLSDAGLSDEQINQAFNNARNSKIAMLKGAK